MVKQIVKIGHLYPVEMNIYGDSGNVLVLKKRLEWRGIGVDVVRIGLGDSIPQDVDIIVSGGGQDTGQVEVQKDLQLKSDELNAMARDGVVMLAICGTYQLFGHRFITRTKQEIKGIGIFDLETHGGDERLIGNIVTEGALGKLVGYENHSGKTYLGSKVSPLGRVVQGAGNNGDDDTEGAVFNNVFGTYLHGPILPKNPHLADELIMRAMSRRYGTNELTPIDDEVARRASQIAANRPR